MCAALPALLSCSILMWPKNRSLFAVVNLSLSTAYKLLYYRQIKLTTSFFLVLPLLKILYNIKSNLEDFTKIIIETSLSLEKQHTNEHGDLTNLELAIVLGWKYSLCNRFYRLSYTSIDYFLKCLLLKNIVNLFFNWLIYVFSWCIDYIRVFSMGNIRDLRHYNYYHQKLLNIICILKKSDTARAQIKKLHWRLHCAS